MNQRLSGKVALVTGAASGIGLACARRFAEEGAAIAGFDLQRSEAWEELAKASGKALFFEGDVTDGAAQKAAVEKVAADLGPIDILVTAAGVGEAGPVHMVTEEQWRRVIDINLNGTFLSVQAVLPGMLDRGAGSIITVASIEGLVGTEGGGAYNASKGGVVLLTKNVAIDYGRKGIRANAICPGFIRTPMFDATVGQDFMAEVKDSIEHETKLGRFGRPEEIAGAAFFLASDDASFVTGHSLVVDGGYTAGHAHGIVEMMGLV